MAKGLEGDGVSGWQPIETAPRDGSVIDVWLGEATVEEVRFYCTPGTRRSAGWHFQHGKFRPAMGLRMPVIVQPTHWMPVPGPPKGNEKRRVV